MDGPMAEMHSRGRQFPEIIQVHAILGQRAIARGLLSEASLQSQLSELAREHGLTAWPTAATTRRWALEIRDYPEQALSLGIVPGAALRPWARAMLTTGSGAAALHQSQPLTTSRQADLGTALVEAAALLACVIWGSKCCNGCSAPPRPLQPLHLLHLLHLRHNLCADCFRAPTTKLKRSGPSYPCTGTPSSS
ncbi:MAG: hypothetical protein HY681_07035 [Chloroflexi bacterium]|nr:hypothetical protein [Chloroflexota bacterium]